MFLTIAPSITEVSRSPKQCIDNIVTCVGKLVSPIYLMLPRRRMWPSALERLDSFLHASSCSLEVPVRLHLRYYRLHSPHALRHMYYEAVCQRRGRLTLLCRKLMVVEYDF